MRVPSPYSTIVSITNMFLQLNKQPIPDLNISRYRKRVSHVLRVSVCSGLNSCRMRLRRSVEVTMSWNLRGLCLMTSNPDKRAELAVVMWLET